MGCGGVELWSHRSPQEMSLLCSSCKPLATPQVTQSCKSMRRFPSHGTGQSTCFALKSLNTKFLGRTIVNVGSKLVVQWSFVGGSKFVLHSGVAKVISPKKASSLSASWVTSSQIACNAFTLGTVAVLPFYTLMVLAPNSALTKKAMESNVPYLVLGALYAYLLYLSWSPDTLRLMFASKYWLPELPGIAKMFTNEMTVASAWIHLLAVDLFAARQVFDDGMKNNIETRHSISLCLLFCPVGILTHLITKTLTKTTQ